MFRAPLSVPWSGHPPRSFLRVALRINNLACISHVRKEISQKVSCRRAIGHLFFPT